MRRAHPTPLLLALLGVLLTCCGPEQESANPARADTVAAGSADADAAVDAIVGPGDTAVGVDATTVTCAPIPGACEWGEAWAWCSPPKQPLPVPKPRKLTWHEPSQVCKPAALDSNGSVQFAPEARHLQDGGLLVAGGGWLARLKPDWTLEWRWPGGKLLPPGLAEAILCPTDWIDGGFTDVATGPENSTLALGQGCRPGTPTCTEAWLRRLDSKGQPVGPSLDIGKDVKHLAGKPPPDRLAMIWRHARRGALLRVGPARWLVVYPTWELDQPWLGDQQPTHAAGHLRVALVQAANGGLELVHQHTLDLSLVPLAAEKAEIGGGQVCSPSGGALCGGPKPGPFYRFRLRHITTSFVSACGHAVFALEGPGMLLALRPDGSVAWQRMGPAWSAWTWSAVDGRIYLQSDGWVWLQPGQPWGGRLESVAADGTAPKTHDLDYAIPNRYLDFERAAPRFRRPPWRTSDFYGFSMQPDAPHAPVRVELEGVVAERANRFFSYGLFVNVVSPNTNPWGDAVFYGYWDRGPVITTIGGHVDEQAAGKCANESAEACFHPERCMLVRGCDAKLGCDVPPPAKWPQSHQKNPVRFPVVKVGGLCGPGKICSYEGTPKCVAK